MVCSSRRLLRDLVEELVLVLRWVALDPAVAAVAVVLFVLTWTRPLDGGCAAVSLVRLMFPAPPRPPACYETPEINTGRVWIDKANVTTHDYALPPRFLRFGFGWLGRERKLEFGHIAGKLMGVVSRLKTRPEVKPKWDCGT